MLLMQLIVGGLALACFILFGIIIAVVLDEIRHQHAARRALGYKPTKEDR
jgi:hypothetical protein